MIRQEWVLAGVEVVRLLVRQGVFTGKGGKGATLPVPKLPPPPIPGKPFGALGAGAPLERPGCTAADETGLAWYHLYGLSKGRGGFGVLRTSQTHLEKAIEGALQSGAPEVADQIRTFIPKLTEVQSEQDAERLLKEFDPVTEATWQLGRRCKGPSPELYQRAQQLAGDVQAGRTTKEAALAELRTLAAHG